MSGALLVAGTTSDAGKSMLVAGICRYLHRQGVRVAPFKAQNMSNNSVVVLDDGGNASGGNEGGEIGRAQALQAAACGLAPSVAFNPVLLKPGGDMRSQVVVRGHAIGDIGATDFTGTSRASLATVAYETFDDLRRRFDVVIAEGAGSPTEINLRASDYVNMGLARHGKVPVIVVADIDRGGAFAALHGTVALLDRADQALIAGFVVNKFRGDVGLLAPGVDMLNKVTGRPTYGVVPWHDDVWLDAEDSLAYPDGRVLGRPAPPVGAEWLRIVAIRLPHISNATDLEAFAVEAGVTVRLTTHPADLVDADLVVLPGTKATVEDLAWLRTTGLAAAVQRHVDAGRPLLGVCGGFQMLARTIHDDVESRRGRVPGLGLLPIDVSFAAEKTVRRAQGSGLGCEVRGYEIHHGYLSDAAPDLPPLIRRTDGTSDGAALGCVYGTHWHGAFESDAFRRAFLVAAARDAGRTGFRPPPSTVFADRREHLLDLLGDLVEEHLDTDALWRLIERGAPVDLPFVPPGAP
ncbi:MAG TPA: cobyric acid synthase [Micromonosporaceae bacterium]|jgi:adenosylcobyric acid synthase